LKFLNIHVMSRGWPLGRSERLHYKPRGCSMKLFDWFGVRPFVT
jgi:hypothetical protein